MNSTVQNYKPTDKLSRKPRKYNILPKFFILEGTFIYKLNKKIQKKAQGRNSTRSVTARPASVTWSYSNMKTNSLMHALNGNKNLGYRVAAWNCRRRLLNSDGSASDKIMDIEMYLKNHQLHMMGIIESDLHGPSSRVRRKNPLSTSDICEKLYIEGYYILLPQSWYTHDQARLLIYVQEGVKVKERKLSHGDSDLPSFSAELGLSREKKTCFNFFYREFTGGVSGLDSAESQRDRLGRQINHWKSLYKGGRDVLCLGDSNLCAAQWEEQNYRHKALASMTHD